MANTFGIRATTVLKEDTWTADGAVPSLFVHTTTAKFAANIIHVPHIGCRLKEAVLETASKLAYCHPDDTAVAVMNLYLFVQLHRQAVLCRQKLRLNRNKRRGEEIAKNNWHLLTLERLNAEIENLSTIYCGTVCRSIFSDLIQICERMCFWYLFF